MTRIYSCNRCAELEFTNATGSQVSNSPQTTLRAVAAALVIFSRDTNTHLYGKKYYIIHELLSEELCIFE